MVNGKWLMVNGYLMKVKGCWNLGVCKLLLEFGNWSTVVRKLALGTGLRLLINAFDYFRCAINLIIYADC